MNRDDVKVLYDAFISLCDYIEADTDGGCFDCPLNEKVCSDKNNGNDFAKTLKRIKNEIDT